MSGNTRSGRPTTVTVSFVIWLIVVLANIIQAVIALVSLGGTTAAQGVSTGSITVGVIVNFLIAIVTVIIVFKMRDGRNWARIVLLVVAIIQVLFGGIGVASGANAFGLIGTIAVIVATILMFVGGANGYFRRR